MAGKIHKILVAEDEKPMAKALVLKLNHSGFEAKAAFNGDEAIAELQKDNYDLLILDLIMPGLDGFGVLEAIQEKGIKVQVIVASNLGQPEDLEKAKGLGAVDYFVKSDTPLAKIVETIENM